MACPSTVAAELSVVTFPIFMPGTKNRSMPSARLKITSQRIIFSRFLRRIISNIRLYRLRSVARKKRIIAQENAELLHNYGFETPMSESGSKTMPGGSVWPGSFPNLTILSQIPVSYRRFCSETPFESLPGAGPEVLLMIFLRII